jgi:hypothetical protein
MTFNDDASERQGRGQVKRQGRRMSALSYGECLYEAIRVGKNFLLLINHCTCLSPNGYMHHGAS